MGWRARRTRITAAMGTTLIPMLGGTALAALTLVGSGTPALALAAGLFGKGSEHRQEAMELASRALDGEPNYVLESYQKEQLWGPQLRVVTQQLLGLQELKAAVERAHANAAPEGNPGEDL